MADHDYGVDVRSLSLTLGVAAVCWVVAVTQMQRMDMGVAATLGSLPFFLAVWTAMMAAMMLPGTAPAVARYARTRTSAALAFLAAYVAVWMLVGVVAYGIYRPHGSAAAGVVTVVAGIYELTPLKRRARQRCRAGTRSGWYLGICCVGSSMGLMSLLLALGAMSQAWMSAIAGLVLVQKLLPARSVVDVPIAAAIVTLGVVILLTPSSIPGLVPSM